MARGFFKGFERPPLWATVVIVVGVVAIVVVGLLSWHRGQVPAAEVARDNAAQASAVSSAPAKAPTVAAPTVAADPSAEAECQVIQQINQKRGSGPVGAGSRTIAVLGDSYAEGQQLANPLDSWPTRFAANENATAWVDAVGGSGFSRSAYCPGAEYPKRAASVLAHSPTLVVVQGGLNDVSSTDDQIKQGFDQTIAALKGVNVVVVGPPPAPQRDPNAVRRVDRDLAAEAGLRQVRYVSALAWLLSYGPDHLHPDVAGQQAFADLLASALR